MWRIACGSVANLNSSCVFHVKFIINCPFNMYPPDLKKKTKFQYNSMQIQIFFLNKIKKKIPEQGVGERADKGVLGELGAGPSPSEHLSTSTSASSSARPLEAGELTLDVIPESEIGDEIESDRYGATPAPAHLWCPGGRGWVGGGGGGALADFGKFAN